MCCLLQLPRSFKGQQQNAAAAVRSTALLQEAFAGVCSIPCMHRWPCILQISAAIYVSHCAAACGDAAAAAANGSDAVVDRASPMLLSMQLDTRLRLSIAFPLIVSHHDDDDAYGYVAVANHAIIAYAGCPCSWIPACA
jgi:hypothetical protein